MRARFPRILMVAIPLLCLLAVVAYNIPFIHDKVAWRVDTLWARIQYIIHPPGREVFVPQEQIDPTLKASLLVPTATSTPTPSLTQTPSPTKGGPIETRTRVPTSTPTLTPIAESVRLTGITHEYQKWNNCGPANLSMALSFWGWDGDQLDAAAFLKPNTRDKNVMPYEMETFVEETTGLQALVRVGGEIELIRRLVAAGFPVVIEKGFEGDRFDGWMGHYEVISGYNETKKEFLVYDSYVGPDYDFPIAYDEVTRNWRSFNYTYLVIYTPEHQAEVTAILGLQADETYNFQYAAQKASDEIYALTGRDQYFAWYNRGSSLVKLQDFAGAAEAYDQAFALYPEISESLRPWRMLWYQTGPYFAYYYSGRYYDVINLATTTLEEAQEPALEESFYWRAMARQALGDSQGAIKDFLTSLEWHTGFEPSVYQLQLLGIES